MQAEKHDVSPQTVEELDDLFSAENPFLALYTACKEDNPALVEQHFKAWWESLSLCTLKALRTKLIALGQAPKAARYLPQIRQLESKNVAQHPPAVFKYNPLHIAAAYGKLGVLEKLIQLISDRSGKKGEYTALAYSLSSTNPAEVPPVTALDFACKYNHRAIIMRLLKTGADPGATKPRGRLNYMTPLMWCILNVMDIKLITALIRVVPSHLRKEYIDTRGSEPWISALKIAITNSNVPTVRELLLNGASINLQKAPVEGNYIPGDDSKEMREAQRDIAQLLLIFASNNDNNVNALERSNPSVSTTPPDLAPKRPGFHLCRVACRLINRAEAYSQQGDDIPVNFLRKLLEYLPQKSLPIEKLVLRELSREETGWFNTKHKAALNNKNFHYYFLEQLAQDAAFLNCLNMQPEDYTQFSEKDSVRAAFLDQLTQNLSGYIKSSSCFVTRPLPQAASINK
jgi:ankyrin repeat protein